MKQHITVEQLENLKSDEKVCILNTLLSHEWNLTEEEFKYYTWNKILNDSAEYCTIGRMIDVISSKYSLEIYSDIKIDDESGFKVFIWSDMYKREYIKEELCDALWEIITNIFIKI